MSTKKQDIQRNKRSKKIWKTTKTKNMFKSSKTTPFPFKKNLVHNHKMQFLFVVFFDLNLTISCVVDEKCERRASKTVVKYAYAHCTWKWWDYAVNKLSQQTGTIFGWQWCMLYLLGGILYGKCVLRCTDNSKYHQVHSELVLNKFCKYLHSTASSKYGVSTIPAEKHS